MAVQDEPSSRSSKAMYMDDLEDLEEGSLHGGTGGTGKGKGSSDDDDEEPDNEGDEDLEKDDNDGEDKDDDKKEKKDRYCKGVKRGCSAPARGNYDCCKEFGCRRRRRGGSCNAPRRLTGKFPPDRRRVKKNLKDPGCSAHWFIKDGKKCSEKDPATRTINSANKNARKAVKKARKAVRKAVRKIGR